MWGFLFILAFIALTLFLSVTIIDHLFAFVFLYIEYRLGNLKTPEIYPNVTTKRYLYNFVTEFAYVMGKYYLYPFKFRNLTQNFVPGQQYPTVILLIHGYSRNQSDWLWFIKQLLKLECPIFTVNLSPSLASIQQITNNSLAPRIKLIKQQTSCAQIILIGHSMGGLVASYYAEYLDEDNLIQNIITIGTPFHGTKLSVVASGANGQQMCPDTKFGKELIAKIEASKKNYYNIASRLDNIVFPWQSQVLNSTPREHTLVLPLTSHLGMLHSLTVVEQILNWISGFVKTRNAVKP